MAVGDSEGLKKLANALEKQFKITSKVNPSVITGVQVVRDRERRWLKLHQGGYTSALLEMYDRLDAKPVDTPMDPGTAKVLMLLPVDDCTPQTVHKYQHIVDGLMWLLRTRPDIQFTI